MELKDIIRQIKSRLDISEVISYYTNEPIRRIGSSALGVTCPNPQHTDGKGHDSFRIDESNQKFKCFNPSCRDFEGGEFQGDIFDFVRHMEGGISLIEAMNVLIKRYSFPFSLDNNSFKVSKKKKKEEHLWKNVYGFYHNCIKSNVGRRGYNYITNRGISPEMIEKFYIGYTTADKILKYLKKKKGFEEEYLIKKGLVHKKYKKDKFFNRVNFPSHLYRKDIQAGSYYPNLYIKGKHEE